GADNDHVEGGVGHNYSLVLLLPSPPVGEGGCEPEARSYFPLPLWERVDASRQARSYFPLPLWERVASEARRVRGTTRRNLQSMLRSEPGGETSKLREDASEAAAKGRSPR